VVGFYPSLDSCDNTPNEALVYRMNWEFKAYGQCFARLRDQDHIPAGVDKCFDSAAYFLSMGERHRRVFLGSFDTLSADDFLDRPLVFARPSDWHQALENEIRQATNRNFIQHNNAALTFVVTLPSRNTAEIAMHVRRFHSLAFGNMWPCFRNIPAGCPGPSRLQSVIGQLLTARLTDLCGWVRPCA
jgi:hypothetical protein